jgi:arylsulfatase
MQSPTMMLTLALFAGAAIAPPAQAADGDKPNFLVILADDLGYSDLGAYGGEIQTPHVDRLAENGLRYTQFYNTGRCWPTRTALLTGYYPQQVGMDPARRRQLDGLPPWAGMLPDYFEPMGYRTYHSGKWHIFLEDNPVADGGFDRSYLITDGSRYFYPNDHYLDDKKLPPVKKSEDYYQTTEIADRAIDFLKQHKQQHSDKPFLTYLAFTAPHFPLHAPQEDIARYDGVYDKGWDKIRRQRLARMKAMGIVDADLPLPPRQPNVVPHWNLWSEGLTEVFGPKAQHHDRWGGRSLTEVYGPGEVGRAIAWSKLSDKEKAFQAKKMQIHAAMIDRMDREIGRVLKQIRAMGERENTVVLFLSDNGASAEQIVRGDGHERSAPMGSGATYLCLGPGWSTASNTPMRLHKSWVHEGGAATPFIINYPARFSADQRGALRDTPGHAIDLLPTMLDLAGDAVQHDAADGPPLPGKSLVPSFDGDTSLGRAYLFFFHDDNKALRVGDWKLVSPRRQNRWQLYDMSEDRNELNDLASEHPGKVKQMRQRWEKLKHKFDQQWRGSADGE